MFGAGLKEPNSSCKNSLIDYIVSMICSFIINDTGGYTVYNTRGQASPPMSQIIPFHLFQTELVRPVVLRFAPKLWRAWQGR